MRTVDDSAIQSRWGRGTKDPGQLLVLGFTESLMIG